MYVMHTLMRRGSSNHIGTVTATKEPATSVLASAATALTGAGGWDGTLFLEVGSQPPTCLRGAGFHRVRYPSPTFRCRSASTWSSMLAARAERGAAAAACRYTAISAAGSGRLTR